MGAHMVALPETTSPTIEAIEAAVEAEAERDFDMVVRASSIGHACERFLWYKFRWAFEPETFNGRQLRLFETGHLEEYRMIVWLKKAGCEVHHLEPNNKQIEVTDLDGHFAGHLDGIVTGLKEAPKTPHLLECKTHKAKSFAQFIKHGVTASHPEHMAQMQVYMHLKGLTRACYMAKNKDTDQLHIERVHYDQAHALALMAKAERIKNTHTAPARVSDDPAYYLCAAFNCPAYDICHGSTMPLRNCRTCLHSYPDVGGRWHCVRHKRDLTIDDQKAGCAHHLFLPSLVPGEQIDADDAAETVTYQMPDGRQWVDGGAVNV